MKRLRGGAIGLLVIGLVLGGLHADVHRGSPGGPPGIGWDDVRAAVGDFVGARPGAPAPEPLARVDLPRRERVPTGASVAAARRVRELTARRTPNATFYQLSDGRTEAVVSSLPVYYRDAAGTMRPIDTRVSRSGRPGESFANRTNTFATAFGTRSDRLVAFDLGGRSVSVGAAGPARPIAPAAEGSSVTFPGAFGAGIDLGYRVTATALKNAVVLARAPSDPSFAFTLDLRGLTAKAEPDGSIGLYPVGDRDGTPLLALPRPFMYDARADASSPYGAAWSPKVTQTLTGNGAKVTVTLTADRDWLADPARVYPVTIDPTIKIQPTVSQSQDAMIVSDDPNGNYDGNWRLSVGTTATAKARSLMRFDLSGVPTGTQLDAASLQLYFDQDHTTSAFDVPMEARRVTAPWSESTVTWNSINAALGEVGANVETVDDTDTAKTAINGEWPASTNTAMTQYGVNGTYRFNKNAITGETFSWVPRLTESGDYTVEAHYVAASDRTTAAPYTVRYSGGQQSRTVNQTSGTNGVWTGLGTYPFVAGTSHSVVLGDVTDPTRAVIADAVRFTKPGTAVKKANQSSVWHSYSVRSIVQSWLDGTQTNNGFMVKAVDEATLGRGGPRYEAAEYAYNGENENTPKLVLTYGKPSVDLDAPTTIYSTGAALNWTPYGGGDLVEYQVHRSVFQTFTPSAATLVSPVKAGVTSFTDTTATPTPVDSPDPFGQVYYYMVAVKTTSGALIPGPTQIARLPRAGRIVQLFQGDGLDTTLSSIESTTGHDVLAGNPWLSVGDNSTTFGKTRAVVRFPSLSAIPPGARVLDASFQLWSVTTIPAAGATYEAHALTRTPDESATWTKATSTTAWTTVGGDFSPTVADTVTGNTNDPAWREFTVSGIVQGWVDSPTMNNGLLVKLANETTPAERTLFLSSEAPEPQLRPKLVVTYTQPTPVQTYFAPSTPTTRMIPGDQYSIPVTVSNPTGSTWLASQWVLSYHWTLPDGTDVTTGGNQLSTPLPADVPPGGAVDVNAQVKTPIQSDAGNKRSEYVLRWELRNTATGQWLSTSDGIGPLDQNVVVEDPTSDQLGLEKFYQYVGVDTGAGSTAMANLFTGNVSWGYNPISNPSRGLSTFVRVSYNSLDTSTSSMGFGWSLTGATLHRLGSPLELHPPGQDWPTQVTLIDGDGTSHYFTLNKHGSTDPAAWDYDHPAGVHLYLRKNVGGDASRAWVMTKPDRTRFYFDEDGYQSATADNNGNELLFTYAERRSNNKPTKFLQYITDASNRRTLTLSYFAKGDDYTYIDSSTGAEVAATNLTNPKIIDEVKSVTDISGRTITFTYTTEGLLGKLLDGAGSTQPKPFRFRYDMTQGNKNVKLVAVTDPRGNTTNLAYFDAPTDPKFKWSLQRLTDRLGNATNFAYVDPDGSAGSTIDATVTDAEQHAAAYHIDGFGRPERVTNALSQTTRLTWDADNNAVRLEEADGAATTWAYDANTGYPLEVRDGEANAHGFPATRMTYLTGLNGHIADLATKTSPEGRAWTFGYDGVGNLVSVTDPAGTATPAAGDFTTRYDYDLAGQVVASTDANGHRTTFDGYGPTGYPDTTTDALGKTTRVTYDDRGHVLTVTDARTKTSSYGYDTYGRLLDRREPKDQNAGVFIVTPAPTYDANDNAVQTVAPNGAITAYTYDADDRMASLTQPKDTPSGPNRATTYAYDRVGNLLRQTDPLGSLTPSDPNDFVTTFGYDAIYELVSVANSHGQEITYSYDSAGNVTSVVDPNKNATADPNDATRRYTYDRSHRVVTVTDAAGNAASNEHDRDGLVVATTDREGNKTLITYDARGKIGEIREPHDNPGGAVTYRTTRYEYDQVGNQTRVITPRGTATTDDPDDFAQTITYDEVNRVKEKTLPYDRDDPRVSGPTDKIINTYDEVGRIIEVSGPPSQGQTVRNKTTYSYFDNGWMASSTDAFDIATTYDYDPIGKQSRRTIAGAGGSSSRTMSWSYYPDGKLKARGDDGVPVGLDVVLVDNSDTQNTSATGTWPRTATGTGFQGFDYATHAGGGTGTNAFTWTLNVPSSGTYEVFVKYAAGGATNAPYVVTHDGGSVTRRIDQTHNAGQWVSLGSFAFAEGNQRSVKLTDDANGTVVADAVKLVRDNSADPDTENKAVTYTYDANGNLLTIDDASSTAPVDRYDVTYTDLNQVDTVRERKSGSVLHTTSYTYDPNGNPLTRTHDGAVASYVYDPRDLVSRVTNATSATDPDPKVTTFTYTPRGKTDTQIRGNGNTVQYTYFLDGLLRTQVERKSGGTLVSQHTIDYDLNGNRVRDDGKTMNADNHSAYVSRTQTYVYDPRDRVSSATKTDPGTGNQVSSESYVYDAANNIVSQTVGGVTTTDVYDRDRLQSSTVAGQTSTYNYDPFGRLDTITFAGQTAERWRYDGFDRTTEHRVLLGATAGTTRYTYDPLDRTATKTEHADTAQSKTTSFAYLGLSDAVVDEEVDGQLRKSYQYSPWGARLSQVKYDGAGAGESSYYGYDAHTNVESITDDNGDTRSTYGYTAYGSNDDSTFTGVDKPDPADPTKEPYNPYRFNAKRWDPTSGNYDMGFRDYDPGLNRFLTRDIYNGALADLRLGTDPWTMNRYAFAGGNPVTRVELDGHCWSWAQDICDVAGDTADAVGGFVSDHSEEIIGGGLMVVGALMIVAGAGGEAGGLVLDATGVGALIGVPINVASAGLILAGAGVFTGGAALFADGVMNSSSSGGSSGGSAEPPPGPRTPQEGSTEGGPGKWVKVNRGGSDASKAYQEKATGVTRGNEYEVNGVQFDGYDNGTLIEAKDEYLQFVDKSGNWQPWFRGKDALLKEARSQVEAAQGNPLEWRVSDPRLKEVLERTFKDADITGIQVRFFP